MNLAFTNYDELKREMAMIKLQKEKNNFVKKQFFAYEIYEIMKQNGFTGIKLLNEHNWFFDAKNEKEDYELSEVARFRKLIMSHEAESNFKGLKTLSDRAKSFLEEHKNSQLHREIAEAMYGKTMGMGCDYKSVCEAVITPSEYQEFTVLIEQKLLSQKNPFDNIHDLDAVGTFSNQDHAEKHGKKVKKYESNDNE